jgi:tRNA threonylcarbamoyladenosine biosynthesis protein TsaB
MKILAIDTTSKTLSLGLYDAGKVYEYNLEVGRRLSALLAPTIKRVFDVMSWQPQDIDYFGCGLGPGSFTGVRIGLATIKGLALALNKPVVGVSTLDILAQNAKKEEGLIIPIVDAKRSLIYCAIYRIKNAKVKKVSPYMLLSPAELLKRIKKDIPPKHANNIVLLGDALNLYRQEISARIQGAKILDRDYWIPWGRNIIELVEKKIREKDWHDPSGINPVYLYPKECQIIKRKM